MFLGVCVSGIASPGQEPWDFREDKQLLFNVNACLFPRLLLFYHRGYFSAMFQR